MRGSIPQRGQHEDTLPAFPALFGALHFGEIIISNGLELKVFGGMQEAQ
jgi:hypothetical protein